MLLAGSSTAVQSVGASSAAVATTAQSYTGASSQDDINLNNYEQPPDQVMLQHCLSGAL